MPHLTPNDIHSPGIIPAATLPGKLPGPGDHRCIVGGQSQGRQQNFNAKRCPHGLQFLSQ
jgi:hypothetical protein